MIDENLNNEIENEEDIQSIDPNVNLVQAMEEMKRNYIPKEKYEKLNETNKQLVEALKNGSQIEIANPEEEPDVNELRKFLYADKDKMMSDVSYVSETLRLRNQIIKEGGRDPFLPNGHDYNYSDTDAAKAQQVADVLQECVDRSDGNNQQFMAEIMRRIRDDSPITKARIRK